MVTLPSRERWASAPVRATVLALAYGLVLAALLLGSTPRAEGDYLEYVAMALQMASLQGPALTLPELDAIRAELEPFGIAIQQTMPPGTVYHFPHFWFYSALAAPGVAMTRVLAVHPVYGFALLNLALIGGAAWLLFRRHHWTVALLVLGSPVVWWIDKAHTEVFTFSLLAIAMTLASSHPGIAMVCAGAAATQNPPIAVAVPLIALAATRGEWRRLRERALWVGAAIGMCLAILHPAYYLFSVGTPTALGARGALPSAQELTAVIWDPNIGLVVGFPLFALAVAAAIVALIVRNPARLGEPVVLVSLALGGVFLLAFAQAPNINSGATPSMSRYALWLIPLALPVLARAHTALTPRVGPWAAAVAVASAVGCLVMFPPGAPSRYLEPSATAEWLWTRFPSLDNPVPEIFAERVGETEFAVAPVARPGCAKVLLLGREAARGMWPVPCAPEPVPAQCLEAGAACYANRSGGRYAFVPVDARDYLFLEPSSDLVWPSAAEARVGRVLEDVSWQDLQPSTNRESTMVRAVYGTKGRYILESDDTLFLVLARPEPGASVTLRPPSALEGGLVDLASPDVTRPLDYQGPPGEVWNIDLDPSNDLVILYLR